MAGSTDLEVLHAFKEVSCITDEVEAKAYLKAAGGNLNKAVEMFLKGVKPATWSWYSVDPRYHTPIMYPPEIAKELEDSYKSTQAEVKYYKDEKVFTINVRTMRQYNAAGYYRTVVRGDPTSTRKSSAAQLHTQEDYKKVIQMVDGMTKETMEWVTNPDKPVPEVVPPYDERQVSTAVKVFDEIIAVFLGCDEYKVKYDCREDEYHRDIEGLRAGEHVPEYFANVKGGHSMFRRKALSLLGLRNLLIKGVEIFNELKRKHFHGDMSQYSGDEGPNKMKWYTGNTVDLDTIVLRCTDQSLFDQMNKQNREEKKPDFRDFREFSESKQARNMAFASARVLIDNFLRRVTLSSSEMQERNVCLVESMSVPIAKDNASRGKWPMWQVCNPT